MTSNRIVERSIPSVPSTLLTGIDPLLKRLYLARGVRSSKELELKLRNLLHPDGLTGLKIAVDLLATAIHDNKHITIVGDYDADGATASALAVLALRALGGNNVDFLIPNRFTMGYGLAPELVAHAAAQGADLILTVDTGVSSIAGINKAVELNIPVIVTDHHLPGDSLPPAHAIVNPNLPGNNFPGKYTAGVGVVFYLLAALRQRLQPQFDIAGLLDLVALGTVADLVPLDHNNRILVQQGLQNIRMGRCRPGITALLQVAKRNPAKTTSQDLAFYVGPRLNAAGRLKNMDEGVACLLCDDAEQAFEQANNLDKINRERRDIEAQMQIQADLALNKLVLANNLALGLCLYDKDWHQGVIGILASRLKAAHQRPTIILAPENKDGLVRGSARSIPEVHMRDILVDIDRRYPGMLVGYGGHAMAAGLTLRYEHITNFSDIFADTVYKYLNGSLPKAQIITDGILDPSAINIDTAKLLYYAGPWGQGFPAPIFHGEFKIQSQRYLKDIHLKLQLETADNKVLEAMAFNWGTSRLETENIHIAYRLEVNEYRGKETPTLLIEHLEPI